MSIINYMYKDTLEELMEKGKILNKKNINFVSLHADFIHDITPNLVILPVA